MLLREYNGIQIPQREEDGYISLTKMGQATDKRVNHYLENRGTHEFLNALAEDTGIPAGSLVQVRQGVETFAHPDVAVHFAQWASPAFAVQVSRWVRELLTNGQVSVSALPQDQFTIDIGRANALTTYLEALGVHRPLVATKLLQIVGEKHNALDLTDTAKALVGSSNPEVDRYYTATEIGALLVPPLTARKLNPLLASKGLLGKNTKNEWVLTELGKQIGVLIPYTASNKRSGFQIKWKVDVLPLLQTEENEVEEDA